MKLERKRNKKMFLLIVVFVFVSAQHPVLAGLSSAVGAGAGDSQLFIGNETHFFLVFRDGSNAERCPSAASRVEVHIEGPDGAEAGFSSAACSEGEMRFAWQPCLVGWHTLRAALDGASLQNVPRTFWVSGEKPSTVVVESGAPAATFDFNGLMRGT